LFDQRERKRAGWEARESDPSLQSLPDENKPLAPPINFDISDGNLKIKRVDLSEWIDGLKIYKALFESKLISRPA